MQLSKSIGLPPLVVSKRKVQKMRDATHLINNIILRNLLILAVMLIILFHLPIREALANIVSSSGPCADAKVDASVSCTVTATCASTDAVCHNGNCIITLNGGIGKTCSG
jgi:hypothetical protein